MELKYGYVRFFCKFPRLQQLFIFLLLSSPVVYGQSIVINEVSQGMSGNQEYVEFLVTGPNLVNCTDTPPCLDLRGYIFDDNNGYLNGAPTSGVGIASGACRFSQDPFWSCIPAGTLIVIYNDADINGSIPPQDLSTSDGNCLINVPVSSALFERHTTLPSASNSSYATTGWVSGGSWTQISMANSADGFQIYAPTNTTVPVFSVGWGSPNTLGTIYMGSSTAAGKVFYSTDCNYYTQASWVSGSASGAQSPGFLNAGQASCAGLMNANCDPPTVLINPVAETCMGVCDGSASASVSGGMPPYQFSWSPVPGAGQGTSDASGLCAGSYTLTVTNDNGNGCVLTQNVVIAAGVSCCLMTNTESFSNESCAGLADGTISLTQSGGVLPVTFSIDGGATTQSTGSFSGLSPGNYDILIEDGSGCQYTSVITISAGPAAVVPGFSSVASICSGDPLSPLPTTSTNGINGSWSPALDNTTTTNYTFTPTPGQCANSTSLIITVNPVISPLFNSVSPVCSGGSLTALPTSSTNGITGTWSPALDNTVTTTYTFSPSSGQCATTSDLIIVVNSVYSSSQSVSLCVGSDYLYPDGTVSTNILADESHQSTLSTINGCDSIINTQITVVTAVGSTQNSTICSGADFTFPDGAIHTSINSNETYTSLLTSVSGCDSSVTTNIFVNPVYSSTENFSRCENEVYFFPDGTNQVITSDVIHVSNLVSVLGCDSLITTNITMIPSFAAAENVTVCENTNYVFPDGSSQVITTALVHVSNLVSVTGCDSLVTTTILMNPVWTLTENVVVCEGEDYVFPDGTTHFGLMADESYTSTFSSVNGCDSIWITQVTVQPNPTVNAGSDLTVCEGDLITLAASGAVNYSWTGGISNGVAFAPASFSTVFTVTGTDAFGCQGTDDVQVSVSPALVPSFTADVTAGCAPLMVTFENLTSGGANCSWSLGDGTVTSGCGQQLNTYTQSGLYDVSLTVTDIAGCIYTTTASNYIEVYQIPSAAFVASRYVLDEENHQVDFINNSSGASWYEWNFGDGTGFNTSTDPTHEFAIDQPNSQYTVTLVAGNGANCTDTALTNIIVQDVLIFYVPNAFTPDGDAFNEVFKPVFTSGYDPYDFHLMIFNRWGELVFESYNSQVGWNGDYSDQGLVQDDVYVWKIDFKETMSDKRHEFFGHVTVLK